MPFHSLTVRTVSLLALLLVPIGCDGLGGGGVAVGTLDRDRIELTAEVVEPVGEILVREGDEVKAGDVLLRLNSDRTALRVAMATADRDGAAARLRELETGPRLEQVASARASLAGAEETFREASRAKRRIDTLVSQGTVSVARQEEAAATLAQAEAARDAAAAKLTELENGTRDEVLDQARAALKKAELLLAETTLSQFRLSMIAPRDGIVEALPFEVGERPLVGQTLVVMLAKGAPYARVYVPEKVKARIDPASPVEVHVEGVSGSFTGHLRYLNDQAAFTPFFALTEHDRGRLSYLAEVELEGEGVENLPTGLPVEVRFGGGQ